MAFRLLSFLVKFAMQFSWCWATSPGIQVFFIPVLCFLNILVEIIHLSTPAGGAVSADDFLPCLIYVVLKANPTMLHSNVQWVTIFVHSQSISRHSKSNPIELNFNQTQSNSIELNRTQSVDWVWLSSAIEQYQTHWKEKNQSNPIEHSIFELVIYVKQTLKIHYQILEARVTSALSVAHVFFVNDEIPQKWLQMRCGS